ncbi:hypothetical protein [Actinacidiphila rubida]|nr:hypothetical protein [Actinacidiphila rubida]
MSVLPASAGMVRRAPGDTLRVATDGRTVADIAHEIVRATGWA